MTHIGTRGARLLADVAGYIAECEEANALLDFAERAPVAIQWDREAKQSLRDALRKAKRESERSVA